MLGMYMERQGKAVSLYRLSVAVLYLTLYIDSSHNFNIISVKIKYCMLRVQK